MRKARVLYNNHVAGILLKSEGVYRFTYDRNYLATSGSLPVSLTLPLREQPYESDILFPAFLHSITKWANEPYKALLLGIDDSDYFGQLIATGTYDRLGPLSFIEDHDC
jgi:serine/threonine-protein kinase HipA